MEKHDRVPVTGGGGIVPCDMHVGPAEYESYVQGSKPEETSQKTNAGGVGLFAFLCCCCCCLLLFVPRRSLPGGFQVLFGLSVSRDTRLQLSFGGRNLHGNQRRNQKTVA